MFSPTTTNNNVNTAKCQKIDTKSDTKNCLDHKSCLLSIVTTENDFHIVDNGNINLDDIKSNDCSNHDTSQSKNDILSIAPILVYNQDTLKSTKNDIILATNTQFDIKNGSNHDISPLSIAPLLLYNQDTSTYSKNDTIMAINTQSDIKDGSNHDKSPSSIAPLLVYHQDTSKSPKNDTILAIEPNTQLDIKNGSNHDISPSSIAPILVYNQDTSKSSKNDTILAIGPNTQLDIKNGSNHDISPSSIAPLLVYHQDTSKSPKNDTILAIEPNTQLDIKNGSNHDISPSSIAPILVYNQDTSKSSKNDTILAIGPNTQLDIKNGSNHDISPSSIAPLLVYHQDTSKSSKNDTILAIGPNTQLDIKNGSNHDISPSSIAPILIYNQDTSKSPKNDTILAIGPNTQLDIKSYSDHDLPPLATNKCNLNTIISSELDLNGIKSDIKDYLDHELPLPTLTNALLPIHSHNILNSKTKNEKSDARLISINQKSSIYNAISKYECDICGKIFIKRILIIEHFKTSLCFPESPFWFENNSSKYNWSNNLKNPKLFINSKNNLEINNMKESYKCRICQTVIQNSFIKNHQILHTKDHNLKCNTCSKINGISYKNNQCTKEKYKCETCEKSFISLSLLKTHRFIHSERKSYNCDTSYINCIASINHKQNSGLISNTAHNRNLDLINKYKFYQKFFNSKLCSSEHTSRVQNLLQNYECSTCSKVFHKRSDIIFHIFKNHQEYYSKYSCDTCSNVCGSSQELVLHLEKNILKCDICPQTFIKSHRLHQHYKWHLGINNFECQYCHKFFSKYSVYLRHEKKHETPFRCNFCNKWLPISSNLNIHLKLNNPFICDICEKVFFQMSSLLSHKQTHIKAKRLTKKSSTIETHKKQHSDQELYICNLCKKSFVQSSAFNAHFKTHIDKDKCNSLDNDFIKSSLNKPKSISTDDGCFKCDLCQEIFSDWNISNAHRCISYKCQFCRKIFNNSFSLKRHYKKYHKNEKPFQCDTCKISFTHLKNLNTHKKKHSKYEEDMTLKLNVNNSVNEMEEKYKCDVCKQIFYKQTEIVAHILRAHY